MVLPAFASCQIKQGSVFGVGSISKFLTMSELDWRNLKDLVDEQRTLDFIRPQAAPNVHCRHSDEGESKPLGSEI